MAEASEWCKKFQTSNNVKDLTQAWELYYHVFRRISKQLPQVRKVFLSSLSVCMSICLFVGLFVCLSVCLSVYLFVCLSVCLFVCLFVCLSVCLSVCLFNQSIYLFQLTTLELQYVSPRLLASKDLELAVPGSYEPHSPIIHIKSVSSSLNVITSKQRPRKLVMEGTLAQQ